MKLQPTQCGKAITREQAAAKIRSHRADVAADPSWYSLHYDRDSADYKVIYLSQAYENGSYIVLRAPVTA